MILDIGSIDAAAGLKTINSSFIFILVQFLTQKEGIIITLTRVGIILELNALSFLRNTDHDKTIKLEICEKNPKITNGRIDANR